MNLKSRTIHFGYAHILPLEALDNRDVDVIEAALKDLGMAIIMKANPSPKAVQFTLKTKAEDVFTLKVEQVGLKKGPIDEPLYALTAIIQGQYNHHAMADIYKLSNGAVLSALGAPMQALQKEATIRTLLGVINQKPSFRYLWENVLKQSGEKLSVFGKPVQGGGLRIVLPPQAVQPDSQEVCSEELLIESFLQDPRYIFVEGQFRWGTPTLYNSREELDSAIDLNIAHAIQFASTAAEKFLDGDAS